MSGEEDENGRILSERRGKRTVGGKETYISALDLLGTGSLEMKLETRFEI